MGFLDGLASLLGLGYQAVKDQHLTGAQREANAFTAEQAEKANEFTHSENQAAMQFSAEQAQQQMDFQERMANTQWQRGVADMKAAGLNPALAYSQGGAVAPSGAMGQSSSGSGASGSSVDPGRGMSMSDILQAARFSLELKNLKKDLQIKDAQEDATRAVAEKDRATAENISKQTSWIDRLSSAEFGLKLETARRTGAEVDSILASTEGQRLWNEWNPRLWELQYRQGEIDIEATVVGIAKTMEEIEKLKSARALDWSEIQYKSVMQGLATAQTALTRQEEKESFARTGVQTQQAKKLSAEAFQDQWRSDFIKEHGVEPTAGAWQSLVQIIGGVNHLSARTPAPKRAAGR